MDKWKHKIVAVFAAAILAGGGFASTFVKADVQTLKQTSKSVVHARVTDIESAWNSEHTMIFTSVTLSVIRTLHGNSQQQLSVRVPGGTVGDYTVKMSGAPEFEKGSSVVAFIGAWDDGVPMVAGYFQGLSTVVLDNRGVQNLSGGSADGLSLADLMRQLAGGGR